MQVDFPPPEGPTSPTVSPAPIRRLKPPGNFSDPYTCRINEHDQRNVAVWGERRGGGGESGVEAATNCKND